MWNSIVGASPIQSTTVHSGTYAAQFTNAGTVGLRRDLSAAVTSGTYIVRAYIRPTGTPAGSRGIISAGQFNNNNGYWLLLSNTRALIIRNRIAPQTSVTGPVLALNTWYRVEVRSLFSDTVGQLEVRVFEVSGTTETEISGSPFGIGTFTGGNGTDEDTLPTNIRTWFFGDIQTGGGSYPGEMDDIALTNDTTYPIGAGKIALAEPGGETAMGWEDETAGASLFSNVNDLPGTPDDVNYNKEDDTDAQIDQMTLATLPAEIPSDADMILMDVYARVGSDGTTARTGRLKIWDEASVLTNGNNVDFAVSGWRILSIGPTDEHQVFALGTRSKANVQDFDIGYENITNLATRARRVSALWANVEWIEAVAGGGGGIAQAPNRNIQINYGGTFAGAGRGVFGRVRRPRGRWGSLRAARVI